MTRARAVLMGAAVVHRRRVLLVVTGSLPPGQGQTEGGLQFKLPPHLTPAWVLWVGGQTAQGKYDLLVKQRLGGGPFTRGEFSIDL